MNSSDKTIALASVGLVATAVGTFLPWSRIGGRDRSGYDTADTFISLASGVLPDALAWVGRWWYVPTFFAVVLWVLAFFDGRRAVRVGAIVLTVLSLTMWWLFVWAGHSYDVLNVKLFGPMVSTVGVGLLLVAALRQRSAAFPQLAKTQMTNAGED